MDNKNTSEFYHWSTKVLHWMMTNKKPLIIGSVTVAVVLVITMIGIKFWESHSTNAAELLYQAEKTQDNEAAKIEKLKTVIDKYSLSSAAKLAALELGDIYFKNGDFKQAIEYYKEPASVSDRKSVIKTVALNNLAKSYEELNDYEKAIEYYTMAFNDKNNALRGESYFSAANCYEKLEKYDKAQEIYKKLMEENDFTNMSLKNKSEERLLWIASVSSSK